MKLKTLLCGVLALVAGLPAAAQDPFVNLTPRPKNITVETGSYKLNPGLTVSVAGLDADMAAEAAKFVEALNHTTALNAKTSADGPADIEIAKVASVAPEGYNLTVTPNRISIEASTPCGLYFAFQTIKKVLPANVMAGKLDASAAYELPLMTVNDEPRFEYRGFMLDVCRHFFTVDEIKRMIEVMSYYKMNAFHWHLTEDQGWRIEMPKWPKLMTVGATAPNSRFTDLEAKTHYWINRPYGPYFYTIEEMKDVVAFAAERHITVVPEVEFPGHACAVVTAYPELSCTPQGGHSVKTDGGVYDDVLNVAEPKVMEFAKDVIDVLAEVFPSEIIHIGGDECPTTRWQSNDLCKAKVEELGFTGSNADQKFRKLQNWFTQQLAEYAATKGKRIGAWNEAITAGGADLDLMKKSEATIWCWTGPDNAVNVGTNNGLRVIYTPYSSNDGKKYDGVPSQAQKGSFYINRKQDPNDAPANGGTWDTVDKVYNTHPFTDGALSSHPDLCYGVQGTFWTERVNSRDYLEWLALPRLIAIAEIGWTPQEKKDFSHFIERVKADVKLLDLNGYRYSPYFIEDAITAEPANPAMPEMEPLKKGATYIFANGTSDDFDGITLGDFTDATNLNAAESVWQNNVWTVADVKVNDDHSHVIKLTNLATGRSIASADEFVKNRGRLVRVGDTPAEITLKPNTNKTFTLEIAAGHPFWPNRASSTTDASCVTSGVLIEDDSEHATFSRKMGADWYAVEVTPVEVTCVDTKGTELFKGTCGLPAGSDIKTLAPEFRNHELQTVENVDANHVTITYKRTAGTITVRAILDNGAIIEQTDTTLAVGESLALTDPQLGEWYVPVGLPDMNSVTVDGDLTIDYVYSTEAHLAVKAAGPAVSEVKAGNVYLIYDAHEQRHAYRYATSAKKVGGAASVDEGADPSFVWTFEDAGNGALKIKNMGSGLYVKAVETSKQGELGNANVAEPFLLTYNAPAWTIKNSKNDLCWDGLDNLNMVGWNQPGHPHRIYSFFVNPCFSVNVRHVTTDGKTVAKATTEWVNAGEPYTLVIASREGYEVESIEGGDGLDAVKADAKVVVTYRKIQDGINEVAAPASALRGIYDLQGRRLGRVSRPGVYIINGVKTLVK